MNVDTPLKSGGFVLPFSNARDKHRAKASGASSMRSNRLPFLEWIPDTARNHFVATSAEFAGTTLFLLFAFSGTQVALLATPSSDANSEGTPSHPDQILYISLCFGFSLAVNAWVFFRISGGLFNPAVTLGMCLVGALPYVRGLFLTFAQLLGGIAAAAIVSALFPGPLTVRTSLAGGTSVTQGLFIEMFLTAELVFTIFMLAAEKHKATFIAPIGIGLSLFIAELTGVYFTGGSVNPARSFGPSVVLRRFHNYHWIYWVGPILGSLMASGFYKFIKMLEYETANPNQDGTRDEGEHFNPDKHTTTTPEHEHEHEHGRVSFAHDDHYEKHPARGGLSNRNNNNNTMDLESGGRVYPSSRDGFNGSSPRKYGTEETFYTESDRATFTNTNTPTTITTTIGTGSDSTTMPRSPPVAAQKSAMRSDGNSSNYDNIVFTRAAEAYNNNNNNAGHERSVRTNTYNNRNIGSSGISGMEIPDDDEEYYDKY